MNIQKLASAKGKQVVGHRIKSWTKHSRPSGREKEEIIREYGTDRVVGGQLREELVREHVKDLENQHRAKKEAKALEKDFYLSVLHSSATKRDARSYIQNFTPSKPSTSKTHAIQKDTCGVNLGSFYGPAAVEESPKFVQNPGKPAKLIEESQLHIALVKIRAPQTLTDETIDGIGNTLSQLERLGLTSVVVVDCNVENGPPSVAKTQGSEWRIMEAEQANRIVTAIDNNNGRKGARLVNNVIGISEQLTQPGHITSKVHITLRKLLMTPLRRGVIPVIPCVGYTDVTQRTQTVHANDIIIALTREFAGLPSDLLPDEDPILVQQRMRALREEVSLDRLIILDPLGGIPASYRENGYHVFLNMEQEFESARMDLLNTQHMGRIPDRIQSETEQLSDLASSNPFSKFVETEFGGPHPSTTKLSESENPINENWHHLQNLQLARGVLSLLPPTSSALLTSPEEAANSGKESKFQPARVGTRRQRNPLIHNLLTDKPVFSSSLPVGRLAQRTESPSPARNTTPTTFVKHGISVTSFPDPKKGPWEPPIKGQPRLTLTSSQIDLPRLVHLIEDSFGRKLDVQAYLDRVNDRIAGVIVAGEYEGGALLTWELPPGVPDDGSPESRARMVPYLDKFAVLKRSQGNGGVADLIFKAMVRECFPNGVVWRSRKTNPVNKWYFERSRGTWKLPDTGWTMFWTTPELTMDKQLFHDYEGVCKTIEPSWADNKSVLD